MSGIFREENVNKSCRSCVKAKAIPLTEDYICTLKGIVRADFVCKKWEYNIFSKKVVRKREININKFSPKDFSIEPEE